MAAVAAVTDQPASGPKRWPNGEDWLGGLAIGVAAGLLFTGIEGPLVGLAGGAIGCAVWLVRSVVSDGRGGSGGDGGGGYDDGGDCGGDGGGD